MAFETKNKRGWPLILGAAMFLSSGSLAWNAVAQSPDNSGVNKHQGTTADQQTTGTSDRDITAQIRRSIVKDKTLSTYGHNVKIVTKDGAVTLKGPVHSDDEKQNIEAKAAAIAGKDKVTDQLTVKQ